jgi:Acetyltransferase (GNAT) domain
MIYEIDPINDRRWESVIARHPYSSIFHTPGWLQALQRTYGYEPVVYTTSRPQEELTNGLVFCRVSSWITGRRLVSIPFSDHCDPLLEDGNSGADLFEELRKKLLEQRLRYIEIRPRRPGVAVLQDKSWSSESYCFHSIDLAPGVSDIFANFHRRCVRQKIRRAEKEKLVYRDGCSFDMLKAFYHLLTTTRKKHCVPPQPFVWFLNLSECLGPAVRVRLALAGDVPIAGLVTIQFRDMMVAKYSGGDARHQDRGGTPWLFWKTIQYAKSQDLKEMDLGRSDWDSQGLIAFKDHLGGKRYSLNYWKNPRPASYPSVFGTLKRPAGWIFEHAPLPVLTVAGRLLYRHIG